MSDTVTSQVVTRIECWYEYAATAREAIDKGHRRIDDADDERWDVELQTREFKGKTKGYLQTAEVTRMCHPDGSPDMGRSGILRKKIKTGEFCHPNKAREQIRMFQEKVASGDPKPWDHERFYRDAMEKAEAAERAGRDRDLEVVRETLKDAIGGGGPLSAPVASPSVGGDEL